MKLEKGYTSQQLTAFWIQVRRDGLKARRTTDGGWETYGEDAPEETQQFAPVSFVRETGVKMDSHITASRSCGDEITYISNEENEPANKPAVPSPPKDLKDFKDFKVPSEEPVTADDNPAVSCSETDLSETAESPVEKPAKRGFWKRLKSVIQNSKFKIQNQNNDSDASDTEL
jgi:hypothetical protein